MTITTMRTAPRRRPATSGIYGSLLLTLLMKDPCHEFRQ